MSKTFSLFKILADSTFGISKLRYKAAKNSAEILKSAGFLILILISLAPIISGYILYMNGAYGFLKPYGQSGAIITMGVVISSTMVILLGFFYCISIYYFSNDMEHLITLPLKPSQVLGAKFLVILMTEYLTEIPFVLPPVIIYGAGSGAGILYWVYSLIGVIIIPVIPLCIISAIAVFVMRITNIGRRRDLYRIIGGIAAVFIILGAQLYIQNAAINGDPEKIMNVLFAENGIINNASLIFPPAAWISKAFIYYDSYRGMLYLLLFLAVSASLLIGFGLIGEKFFYGGYIGSGDVSASRKSISEERLLKETAARGKRSAIFWREFKILYRVPVFFMNNILPVVLVPMIFVMAFFLPGGSEIKMLAGYATGGRGTYITVLIITGVALFTSVANMTPPTSISREGAQFFVSKYIPVTPGDQIMGKLYHSLLLIFAGDLLTAAALGVMIKLPLMEILLVFIISSLASVPVSEIGLIIDLSRPLLVWDNPQKAVKQNLNGVVSMFFNMLWTGAVLFAAWALIPNPLAAYLSLIIFFSLVGIILHKVLISYAQKRYDMIEP